MRGSLRERWSVCCKQWSSCEFITHSQIHIFIFTTRGATREAQQEPINIESSPISTTQRLPTPTVIPDNITAPCPGYQLILPDKLSPFTSYPFLLHTQYTLPWTITVSAERLILYSTKCSGTEGISRTGKNTTPLPCFSCARLHDHTVIMGIRHRILDGTHENTPWTFLTPGEMHTALKRKTQQVNNHKLRALNNATSIAIRNRHIQTWKCLAMAIGESDIPRLRALVSSQVRQTNVMLI